MFTKTSNTKSIDDEVEHVLKEMEGIKDISSESYKAAAENLRVLCDARSYKKPPRWGIEPETIVVAVTNLVGIALVLNYEYLRPLSSKAINLILKGRV